MGGRSIKKLSVLLIFTLQSTTICPEVYLWPSTCRDLALGCTRLLLDQDGLSSEIILSWANLIRLSPPCNDLLAAIRNLRPSWQMGGFNIHNVLEWLKPPLDVIERWQRYLECRRAFHPGTPTFKECEERWTEFRKQMASRRQQEIERWDRQIIAQS
ncbi:hypothetical protein FB451DRAFT_186152 [Mycena latifolia]|nr:hypothetical protein FB451DRAFT_186152 [Mycena latifolia]